MKSFLSFSIICIAFQAFSQVDRTQQVLSSNRARLVKLELETSSTTKYLPCPFSESSFKSSVTSDEIEAMTVIKVYYVYTAYRQNPDFNQLELDKKRFLWLSKTYPSLLTNPLIEWEIIEQTGCTNPAEGDLYFHGFIVVHRPLPGIENREDELNRITYFIENPTDIFQNPIIDPIQTQMNTTVSVTETVTLKNTKASYKAGEYALYEHLKTNLKNSDGVTPQRVDKWVSIKFTVGADGKTDSLIFLEDYPPAVKDQVQNAFNSMEDWTAATLNGKSVSSDVTMEIRVSYSGEVKGMYTRDGIKPDFSELQFSETTVESETGINLLVKSEPISVKSSAVYKGLEIVKQLQNTAIVMDVTGSMTLHIAALINWVKTNKLNAIFTSYTFFNDGNSKTTKQKKIGETGGIYLVKSIAEIDKTIKEAMAKGDGGESPENDLEAVTYAFQNDEQANQVLLIADNFSEVRDIELLQNINRPVHVLVCAAPKFVRCEYLKIAKDTGGFILLNGEKIDLSSVQKGQTIQIQKVDYRYNGNEFKIEYDGEIHY